MNRAGFTLLELLIGLVVTSIVMLGVAAVVIGQSQNYEQSLRTREANANARAGLATVERFLRRAGYGVHPRNAFHFGGTRDSATAPDELVFYARDPAFARRVTATVSGAGVTVTSAIAFPKLYKGQVMQLICPNGRTVTVQVKTTTAGDAATSLETEDATSVFPRETPEGCHTQTGAAAPLLAKVDKFRFFVADIDDGTGVRPYLFLDHGLDVSGGRVAAEPRDATPGDGTVDPSLGSMADLIPVAAGVEDFQVAYVMNQDPANAAGPDAVNTNWIVGDAVGTVEAPNPALVSPDWDTAYTHANRYTLHPANIRGVRVSIVVRSRRAATAGERRPALENRPAATATDGFYRQILQTHVQPLNLLSRSTFVPPPGNTGGS